jgi:hypothetical protein
MARRRTSRRARKPRLLTVAQEYRHLDALIRQLNVLSRRATRERAMGQLDLKFMEELAALLAKIGYIRRSRRLPTPDEFWKLMLEVAMLLMKLIAKAFWLQGLKPPRIDPRLSA